ncbi:MAG TPA: hypothetical protein VN784_04855 [Candidatus Limnocylindrales bacterium]|nr:hypothetical protein [Candidatus Limnocylindrales bacterium]
MIKFIFKWLIRLVILATVLVVILLLARNAILRVYLEHQIRAQTGLDAEIGSFSVGLAEPTVTIRNFRLYNPPAFAGTPFLDIREIHAEYDPAALARHELHITLMRFNLGELDVVKNQAGQTNLFSLGLAAPLKKNGGKAGGTFTKQTGLEFTGIDVLNVSIGTAKYIDLNNQRNNRTQIIGIQNCVLKNVKSPADLGGLAAFIALRSGDFFSSLSDRKNSGPGILKLLAQ